MNSKEKIFALGVAGVFLFTAFSGCLHQQQQGSGLISIPGVTAMQSTNPKYAIASYYSSENLTIQAQPPQYSLPLDDSQIVNLATIDSVFHLTDDQKTLLRQNGFVVRPTLLPEDDIAAPYKTLKDQHIPLFITSDTMLHLYHIQFNQILKGVEERELFDKILDLSVTLLKQSEQDYLQYTGELQEAARRNSGFFAVAVSLLQTATPGYNGSESIRTVAFSVPSYVSENVTTELSFIQAQDGYHKSPLFHYLEDYSQYKPRGHYTQSEKLKRYFMTMIWFGRISFLMKGGEPACPSCDYLISSYDAKIQTIQASLIATSLPVLSVNNETLDEIWTRVYSITSFFVGTADDLTPYEYLDGIQTIFGRSFSAASLLNDTKLLELKLYLSELRSPQIYGGTGEAIIVKNPGQPITKQDFDAILEKTKGMRLMGQRFIPDSFMFQQLVAPATGYYTGTDQPFTMKITPLGPVRGFPRGLDVMAVLGSSPALDILTREGDTAYKNYTKQLTSLQGNFSSLNTTEWNRNLYFSWVYTLRSLLQGYDTRYPRFMNTTAWLDKELQTALASWTELRHDTILYAKQSYTPEVTSIPPTPQDHALFGYVEPVPEFYTRLLALTTMTRTGLTALQAINQTEMHRLMNLETALGRLLNISKVELEGTELSDADFFFIHDFDDLLDQVVIGVDENGRQTTMVADVHTDTNEPQQVLEEGVGYVDLAVVAYKVPDGRIIAGVGPVLSYYEFKQPLPDRLTDEQWKEMLQQGQAPSRPLWTVSFIAK
ncbi:MAG TPA: DUF3160 domain-containing protein [Candidatus Thermoplasmatota archaeon]|nr:DUF3160 domain-containing protein [Candidatus Thermoplasmatota archaeon]